MCDAACQKLLLCAACAGQDLLVQDDAQKLWKKDGNHLSPEFQVRQATRLLGITNQVNECFARIGWPPITGLADMKELGQALLRLSRNHKLVDEDNAYCIERADQCEDLTEENQADYLSEIHYVAA